MAVRPRHDDKSTEFGLWTRGQMPGQVTDVSSIDSHARGISGGYTTSNLDYAWYRYTDAKIMLMEEKRYNADLTFSQRGLFAALDAALRLAYESGAWSDSNKPIRYYGFHLLVFERTNPEDGRMWLDRCPVTVSALLAFLRFEADDTLYERNVLTARR